MKKRYCALPIVLSLTVFFTACGSSETSSELDKLIDDLPKTQLFSEGETSSNLPEDESVVSTSGIAETVEITTDTILTETADASDETNEVSETTAEITSSVSPQAEETSETITAEILYENYKSMTGIVDSVSEDEFTLKAENSKYNITIGSANIFGGEIGKNKIVTVTCENSNDNKITAIAIMIIGTLEVD